ncbi:MAG: aldolase [Planctomycetota bacterium]|nr:MAG: aldolase [Planctomycetota bacterium]
MTEASPLSGDPDWADLLARLVDSAPAREAALRPSPDPAAPFHTAVVAAHQLGRDPLPAWRDAALHVLDAYAPEANDFAQALGLELSSGAAHELRARVVQRLRDEALQDLRVDFEDGYGERADSEEDRDARAAGRTLGEALRHGRAPGSLGLRIKTLESRWAPRALRTLGLFWDALFAAAPGAHARFVVTLPKVTSAEQVRVACAALARLEERHDLPAGQLRLELMMESLHTLFDADGRLALPGLVASAEGRCSGVHLGTFDYTASHRVPARDQQLSHPACEWARQLMRVSLGTHGPRLCDGSTHVLPLPLHPLDAGPVADARFLEDRARVHAAWRLHHAHVQHALSLGIEQGWDLHPHQLPARWAALIGACSAQLPKDMERLSRVLASPDGCATTGNVNDDVVTGQALLDDLRRALAVGALHASALRGLGLHEHELRAGSLAEILRARREPSPE